jgi:DnaA family protein
MKQLAFDLAVPARPSFGSFVAGANAELVALLQALAAGDAPERFVCLWGTPGCGRSHLLSATVVAAVAHRPARYLRAPLTSETLDALDTSILLALDDVDRLDASAQHSLFGLYNRMREGSGVLIAAAPQPPSAVDVRPELATRLSWGLVYQVHALSDTDKAIAMSERALQRGFELPIEVRDYVLRHGRRDLSSLIALVDMLDRYSLETHRAVTVALAREVLETAMSVRGER